MNSQREPIRMIYPLGINIFSSQISQLSPDLQQKITTMFRLLYTSNNGHDLILDQITHG
jgi:hypothetical protein